MTTIIGLMGPAGAGKSAAAAFLVDRYGARRYSLADPLKDMVKAAFDLTEAQVRGTQADKEAVDPRYGVSPRWLLQRIGTEGCRATFGADFWTRRLLERIARDAPEVAVVEDVRFINEADAIKAVDETATGAYARGVVWRLHPVGSSTSVDPGTHASETEWLRAPADVEVVPRERGLELLYTMLRTAAASCGLRPITPY